MTGRKEQDIATIHAENETKNAKWAGQMINWVKKTAQYANILIFNTLTGLRPSGACILITVL